MNRLISYDIITRMDKERLLGNRDKAREGLKSQTGMDVGGPTGMCTLFVAGALTGSEIKYASYGRKSYEDEVIFNAGLYQNSVTMFAPDRTRTFRELFCQKSVAIDAVLVTGRLQEENTDGHQIAVVPTITEVDGKTVTEYHVVDSLAQEGLTTYTTIEDAEQYATQLFDPKTLEFSIKPTDEEIERRSQPEDAIPVNEMIEVAFGAYIEMQMDRSDPRFAYLQANPDAEQIGAETVDVDEYFGETLIVADARFHSWQETPEVLITEDAKHTSASHNDIFRRYGLYGPPTESRTSIPMEIEE